MQYYNKNNLPITIGQAIDAYGSTDIKEIKLYGEIDETHGFMVTDQGFYYCVNKPGFFPFENLSDIIIHKEHGKSDQLILKGEKTARFNGNETFCKMIAEAIGQLTNLEVHYEMSDVDAIYYYGGIILNDIKNDAYEDTALTPLQEESLNAYLEELEENKDTELQTYMMNMSLLGDKIMNLVEELELDSDEIDVLEKAVAKDREKQNSMFEQAREMYNKNPDFIKSMTGIDPESIKDKSPEELNQMLDDLCDRFNISKDQLMQLASKFKK